MSGQQLIGTIQPTGQFTITGGLYHNLPHDPTMLIAGDDGLGYPMPRNIAKRFQRVAPMAMGIKVAFSLDDNREVAGVAHIATRNYPTFSIDI